MWSPLLTIAFLLITLLSKTLAVDTRSLKIYTKTPQKNISYVFNNTLQSDFNWYGQLEGNCMLPKVFREKEDTPNRTFIFSNLETAGAVPITILNLNFSTSRAGVLQPIITGFTPETVINPGSQIYVDLKYKCVENPVRENEKDSYYWAIITMHVQIATNQTINFDVIKICKEDAERPPFDLSVIILVILSIIVVGLTTRLAKITSFQKNLTGHEINVKFTIIYMIICSILLITMYYFLRVTTLVYTVIVAVGGVFATTFFLNEMVVYIPGLRKLMVI